MHTETGLKAGKALGDRVADFTEATGLDKITTLYSKVTGRDCGCQMRRDYLNRIFPG